LGSSGARLQIAVDGLDERDRGGAALEGEVGVQDLAVGRDVGEEARRIAELARRDRYDPRFGDARARRCEQRDAMAQRREPAHQRHHHALGPAVALRRQLLVGRHHDVHGPG